MGCFCIWCAASYAFQDTFKGNEGLHFLFCSTCTLRARCLKGVGNVTGP
jgi:hypothetical protein